MGESDQEERVHNTKNLVTNFTIFRGQFVLICFSCFFFVGVGVGRCGWMGQDVRSKCQGIELGYCEDLNKQTMKDKVALFAVVSVFIYLSKKMSASL